MFPARIKRIPPSLLLLLQKRNRRIYIPSSSTIYKWLHNYCDVHSREWFDPIFELNVLRWFPNWRELVLKTIFIGIRINKLIIFSILIFTVTQIRLFTYLLITHRLNIPQSVSHGKKGRLSRSTATSVSLFPFEIDMLASRKPPFAPLRPLHAKIPSSPCPSFVYLPVSSSRLLAFSSLSSASVCVRVHRRLRFKWAHQSITIARVSASVSATYDSHE